MVPLWTRAMRPDCEQWGWAFVSFGSPWVAQRVWAMPIVPPSSFDRAKRSSSSTLPFDL